MPLKKYAERIKELCRENIEYRKNAHPYFNLILSPKRMTENQRKILIRKIQKIAYFLDDFITIPLLRISFGLDTLMGFVPFFGGIANGILSLYLVWLSCTLGIPVWLLCSMIVNIIVDLLLTSIPMLGGVFNMYYTCNIYNYQDLLDWLHHPTPEYSKRIKEGERRPSSAGIRPGEISMNQLKQDVVNYCYHVK